MPQAFAKFCGNYGKLALGFPVWALNAMTGEYVCSFWNEPKGWIKKEVVQPKDKANRRDILFSGEEVFKQVSIADSALSVSV